ncbi:MAG: 2OG-Fe(II) oxygenase [Moraxella sp.]|nr:2OG-Fe(II) oxygenase [Moraxella sp.]
MTHTPPKYPNTDWHALLDDKLDDFITDGYTVLDNVFSAEFLHALHHESTHLPYTPAKLTHGERLQNIRGDGTHWLHDGLAVGRYYLQYIDNLGKYFNQSLFAGIRRAEAHYANYPPNAGYDWHKDNPAGRDERVISAVFYLNQGWQLADGGCLELIDKHGTHHVIDPIMGRLVVFDSNLSHRVQQAHKDRLSIATWLRKDD